ncbi:MAG: metallophosphoesterase family protein [Dehalococcoidales bacterium]|nr:metallophosphoesterase family protein [Dehalococcoidales bacterium]
MDSIALIADIHGNIPALEAVLDDIRNRNISRILCLGDLAGKGPQSADAVDICRDVCEGVVIGNWDEALAREHSLATTPPEVKAMVDWHRNQLGPERQAYLGNLPGTIEFVMSGRNVRLFHATHNGLRDRIFHDDSEERHLEMFENTEFTGYDMKPDIVIYADIHFAFHAVYDSKVLINTGSVGNPLDKTLASYVVLEGEYGSEKPGDISIETVRIPYDIERAVRVARDYGMPEFEPYEIELRTARYRKFHGQEPAEGNGI